MKTRWAPGCNRRRHGDTDEWLKVRSLQLEGEGGLSGCDGALHVCVRVCVCVCVCQSECVCNDLHFKDLLDHKIGILNVKSHQTYNYCS